MCICKEKIYYLQVYKKKFQSFKSGWESKLLAAVRSHPAYTQYNTAAAAVAAAAAAAAFQKPKRSRNF
jgi:hypothetical protein